ncbi:MAG: hypothetical protein AB4372_11730, partial [Xenococcus sp. (in: cyanobacteria)]
IRDRVRCDYIYLRLPTQEDPDPHRKPDDRNEIFADGDFEDFIKPIFDTLDLYHNQNVDHRAIALAWKKLAQNNSEAQLEIVAMEKRGTDKFLLRAKTAPEADKSQLNAEYFQEYYQLKAISEADKKLAVLQRDIEYLKDQTDRIEKDVEELKIDVKQLKTDIAELKPIKDKVDRAEWWFRAIAAGLIVSFFKEQIWGFLT